MSMSREPRLMGTPNSQLINVDVTLLHLGLSRCRSIAEDTLGLLSHGQDVDIEQVLNEIIDESRKTLYGIEDNAMHDEVSAVLAEEENG